MVREARKATSRMEPPEPRYGLYLAAALIGAAMLSLFSKDVEQVKNLHGSGTHYVAVAHAQVVTSVTGAVALALISAMTIYWRKRLVTMVAFMLTSVFSLTLPLPQNLLDLRYVIYLAPLAYALWLYFRQNKAQKILLAKEAAASGRASAPTSTSARQRTQETRRVAAPKPQGKQSKGKQVVPTTGRPLPANNRRYTRPQAKGRSGQRKR
jgi:hypothetical protein